MRVMKVYGPGGWKFLVVAKDDKEAYNMVEKHLMEHTYNTAEDLHGEIQFDDHIDFDVSEPRLIEL